MKPKQPVKVNKQIKLLSKTQSDVYKQEWTCTVQKRAQEESQIDQYVCRIYTVCIHEDCIIGVRLFTQKINCINILQCCSIVFINKSFSKGLFIIRLCCKYILRFMLRGTLFCYRTLTFFQVLLFLALFFHFSQNWYLNFPTFACLTLPQ